MIGSGIYIVDADIARGTSSPALFLGAWIVTAILTLIGALSYGELAAMMPTPTQVTMKPCGSPKSTA